MRSFILVLSILFCSTSFAQEECPSVQSILDLIGTPYEDPSVPEYLKLGIDGDQLAACYYYVKFDSYPDDGHRLCYARFLSKTSVFGEYETYVEDLVLKLKWGTPFDKVFKTLKKSKDYGVLEARPQIHEISAVYTGTNKSGTSDIEVGFKFTDEGLLEEITLWKFYLR